MNSARQPDQPGWRARPITIQKLHIRRIRYIYLEFFEEHLPTLIEELRSVQPQSSSAREYVSCAFASLSPHDIRPHIQNDLCIEIQFVFVVLPTTQAFVSLVSDQETEHVEIREMILNALQRRMLQLRIAF